MSDPTNLEIELRNHAAALPWGNDSEVTQGLLLEAADAMACFASLNTAASDALALVEAKRERGDFDHWGSFTMRDLGDALITATHYFPDRTATEIREGTQENG